MSITRWKLTFEFDGTDFKGWQRQKPGTRTVQGVIEDSFFSLYQKNIAIAGQGRTDSGVHALQQTAHADLPDTFEHDRILRAINSILPGDVALLSAVKTDFNFHARFNAIARRYQYRIITRQSPLQRHYAWYVPGDIEEEKLHYCADLIMGENDFINFCKPPQDKYLTTLCTIKTSRWKKLDQGFVFEIEGNRFLRHLVRRLVGTMVQVSQHEISTQEFEDLLKPEEKEKKGHSAPPHGLVLKSVSY